jgi:hypothetical protein
MLKSYFVDTVNLPKSIKRSILEVRLQKYQTVNICFTVIFCNKIRYVPKIQQDIYGGIFSVNSSVLRSNYVSNGVTMYNLYGYA